MRSTILLLTLLVLAPVARSQATETPTLTVEHSTMDVRAILDLIAIAGGVQIVPADDVSGPLVLQLNDVAWDQALAAVVKTKGLATERDGNTIKVFRPASTAH
jgi:type IV pilus assembly protein PilQ